MIAVSPGSFTKVDHAPKSSRLTPCRSIGWHAPSQMSSCIELSSSYKKQETVNIYRCVLLGRPLSFSMVRLLRAGWFRTAVFSSAYLAANICCAQVLAPRTYVITPIHSNAVTLTYSLFDGSLLFEGTVPITGATARTHVTILNYSCSLNIFRRSANFTASLPYGVGKFRGTVVGAETLAYRSVLLPATFRFSVNLTRGRVMSVAEFMKWRQKTILGVSFRLVPQTGQYDPTQLLNLGRSEEHTSELQSPYV